MPTGKYEPGPVGGTHRGGYLVELEAPSRDLPVKRVVFSTHLQAPVPCKADPDLYIWRNEREVSEHIGSNGDFLARRCREWDGREC